jgi:hypothetical protein
MAKVAALPLPTVLNFIKTGAEIKRAIQNRITDLEARLAKRNAALDVLLDDKVRLRAFLVRHPHVTSAVGRQAPLDVPTEDHQEILELCRRISVIEGELSQLRLMQAHLKNDQKFQLTLEQLVYYGFSDQAG